MTENTGRKLGSQEFTLRWGDMDQLGHINNTVYFRAFEEARVSWLAELPEGSPDEPSYVVIIHTEATFLKELKAPGVAKIDIFAGKQGNSSLVQTYELRRTDDPDTVYATGSAKLVWVSPETGRSTPIPQAVRALLQG